jgi:alpha-glucosidase/alpha-D-xyloside xylohydrolase
MDLATMPIYVRAGAIIPVDPVRQSTSETPSEPTALRVYRGADGRFTLYEDDGVSQEYLRGRGTWTRLTWDDRRRQLTIGPSAPEGTANVAARRVFDVVLLPEETTRRVTYTGARVRVTL